MDRRRYELNNETSVATLGAGCFWCIEAVFEMIDGVEKVVSGYAGGQITNPTYQQVCSGTTGHAEVVQVHFHPGKISYETVLEIFFAYHDPTTPNRQGADVGTQYRSVILFHDSEQETIARETIKRLNAADIWPNPIVTEILPIDVFYGGEIYHQSFFQNNPDQPYCQFVIEPKLKKLREKHASLLKVNV